MSGIPFHSTPMGRRYYEHTMPELVRQLTQLNDQIADVLAEARADAEVLAGRGDDPGASPPQPPLIVVGVPSLIRVLAELTDLIPSGLRRERPRPRGWNPRPAGADET